MRGHTHPWKVPEPQRAEAIQVGEDPTHARHHHTHAASWRVLVLLRLTLRLTAWFQVDVKIR